MLNSYHDVRDFSPFTGVAKFGKRENAMLISKEE